MELVDLKVFCAVAQCGGINAAARSLRRVPSNVTARVQRLESDLGAQLFSRQARALCLTVAGREFLPKARDLLRLAEQCRESLHLTEPGGTLRIGAMESAAAVHLPALLARYHRTFPQVKLELSTGSSGALQEQLGANRVEAIFAVEGRTSRSLATAPAFTDTLVLISAAGRATVRGPGDLAGETVLAFVAGCVFRARLETWLGRRAEGVLRVVEMTSYHAMLGCVAAGMGVALVPRSVVELCSAPEALKVHPIPARLARVQTSLMWNPTPALSPRLRALWQMLE